MYLIVPELGHARGELRRNELDHGVAHSQGTVELRQSGKGKPGSAPNSKSGQ